MPVKAFVENLDGVAETLRDSYVEVEGGFVFSPEGFDDGKAREYYDKRIAPGLKTALEKEKEERRKRSERLQLFDALGLPPERLSKLVEEHNKIMKDAEGKIDPQLLEDIRQKQRLEREGWEKERSELHSQLETETVDRQISEAIAAEGGNSALLVPYAKQFIRLHREGDTRAVRVFKEDGSPRVGDADGNMMTPRQFIASLREKDQFKGAFTSTVVQGGGTPQATKGGPAASTKQPKSRKDFANLSEKVQWISKYGRKAFEELPAE